MCAQRPVPAEVITRGHAQRSCTEVVASALHRCLSIMAPTPAVIAPAPAVMAPTPAVMAPSPTVTTSVTAAVTAPAAAPAAAAAAIRRTSTRGLIQEALPRTPPLVRATPTAAAKTRGASLPSGDSPFLDRDSWHGVRPLGVRHVPIGTHKQIAMLSVRAVCVCARVRGALPAEVEAHQLARLHDALALLEDGYVSSMVW